MKIDIYGKEWTVRLVEKDGFELEEISGSVYVGKTANSLCEIIVAKGRPLNKMKETITHELTHAIIGQMLMQKDEFTQEEVCMFAERYNDYLHKKTEEVMKNLFGEIYDNQD